MHVVGARFANLESANAALGDIRASVPMPPTDVAVRPLGSTRYEEPASDFLLAGRFPGVAVERVLRIVELHGGTLLSRRLERPYSGFAGSVGVPASAMRDERGRAPERLGSLASGRGAAPARLRAANKRLRRPAGHVRVRAARGRGFSF